MYDDLTVTSRIPDMIDEQTYDEQQWANEQRGLMSSVDEQWRLRSGCSSIDESVEQMINSIDQQQNKLKRQMMLMWTVSLNYKCKLDLLLRLGYLKPFLAGSKKTRQGPRCKVGALHISRCWFYLTVVARPKLI